ncbi:MAG TPA: hypothetical protein PKE11_13970, partial [Accumulibacter sp.]|uniref:hypothetical protein n=1 Tax=Accumulibacter sp. TaxID=2053492 RepID=UPI002CE3887F
RTAHFRLVVEDQEALVAVRGLLGHVRAHLRWEARGLAVDEANQAQSVPFLHCSSLSVPVMDQL